MRLQVTRAEAPMLEVARFALGDGPLPSSPPVASAPSELSAGAAEVLRRTVGAGVVDALARGGGWRALRGKRLWERRPTPPLVASGNVPALCRWVALAQLRDGRALGLELPDRPTLADEVFAWALAQRLAPHPLGARFFGLQALGRLGLVSIAFFDRLSLAGVTPLADPLDVGTLAVALDGLSDALGRRWAEAEAALWSLSSPVELATVAMAQQQVADEVLAAVDRVADRAAATFVLRAAERWYDAPRHEGVLTRGLDRETPLAVRVNAVRAAGALARAVGTLAQWHDEHRHRRFFDDGYAEAQQLTAAWAALDGPVADHARRFADAVTRTTGG